MEFATKPIEFADKEEMERIRMHSGNVLSAHTFDSLYLWQSQMKLSLCRKNGIFLVRCGVRGENTWLFPCGDRAETEAFIRSGMERHDFALCYIGEAEAEWLTKTFPDAWELHREKESDEYICRMADYIGLSGGTYLGVRHKINRILREHELETRLLTPETMADAGTVVSEWEKLSHHVGDHKLEEGGVSRKALSEADRLGLEGVVVYLEGEPMAVFAGFPINEDTIDALIGKCRHDAPRGFIYYAVREFFQSVRNSYTFCNLEEDLGIPGIRLIKEAMRPERKNLIWTAVQK